MNIYLINKCFFLNKVVSNLLTLENNSSQNHIFMMIWKMWLAWLSWFEGLKKLILIELIYYCSSLIAAL